MNVGDEYNQYKDNLKKDLSSKEQLNRDLDKAFPQEKKNTKAEKKEKEIAKKKAEKWKALLEKKLTNKRIIKQQPRATVVISNKPYSSTFFKDYYNKTFEKEKRSILRWS